MDVKTNRQGPTLNTHSKFWIRPQLRKELVIGLVLLIVLTLVPAFSGNVYWTQIVLLASLYVVAATGLNLLRSEAGQMSFGQGAIFGAAAYGTAIASGTHGLPFWAGAGFGFLAGMIVGTLLALPSLRVQGYYLGFVTLAGALAFPPLLYIFEKQTSALTGITVFVPELTVNGIGPLSWLTILILLVTCLSLVFYAVFRSSRLARQMRVAGASPETAVTLGLRPGWLRTFAFLIASAITSIAGILYIPLIQYVAPSSFLLAFSVLLYFVVVIGGPGTILGPIIGVALLYVLPNAALAGVGEYRLMIYGVIAFLAMFFMPEGVVGSIREFIDRRRKKEATPNVSLAPILERAPKLNSAHREDAGGAAPSTEESALKLERVSKRFGAVRAIDSTTLNISKGHIYGVVGPNGSGKTTLLNAISGLIQVDQGTIVFHGTDISKAGAASRARLGMGRTFQAPRVLDDLSVWENLEIGESSAEEPEWLTAALAEVRDEWDEIPASQLPHAQKRFLEIIRVMRQGPSLLVLDEPASGLSIAERSEFSTLLRGIVDSTGATIILVEHDLELVWQIADEIAVVDNGKVVLNGTPEELKANSTISLLFTGVHDAQS